MVEKVGVVGSPDAIRAALGIALEGSDFLVGDPPYAITGKHPFQDMKLRSLDRPKEKWQRSGKRRSPRNN